MIQRRNNYQLQLSQAKRHFLSYDQEELIRRCCLSFDEDYFYTHFLGEPYRICRKTGDMERFCREKWVDGNSFGEVMTLLDWLCDSKDDRYITGRWINIVTQGHYFHRELQENRADQDAELFDRRPEAFRAACLALGAEPGPGGDMSYSVELVDGLRILIQFWHSDEEFPPRLRFLWDENTTRYIRYETTWYAVGLLMARLREKIPEEMFL